MKPDQCYRPATRACWPELPWLLDSWSWDSVPPGSSSVPDGRVVRPSDPWPTPQVSPGLSRDRCVANADINVRPSP